MGKPVSSEDMSDVEQVLNDMDVIDNSKSARPVVLNLSNSTFIGMCWLAALTALVIVILFRTSGTPDFRAATIDTDRVVSQARDYLLSQSKHKEFVEIELYEFLGFMQLELDGIAQRDDISIVVSHESVLAGESVDYTDYVYLHAKAAYDEAALARRGRKQVSGVKRDQLAEVVQ